MANLFNKIMAEGRIPFELKKQNSIRVPLFKRNGVPLECASFKVIVTVSGAGHESHEVDARGENERIGARARCRLLSHGKGRQMRYSLCD